MISEVYKNSKKEVEHLSDIIDLFSKKQLIPLEPTLYIVRYDESFVSSLDEKLANRVKSSKIVGTVVCIYSDPKHSSKIDKYLPDYCVNIELVSDNFIVKYLKSEFPTLSDNILNYVANISSDYSQSRMIAYALSCSKKESFTQLEIDYLCGHSSISTEEEIKQLVASRNFNGLIKKLDMIEDLNSICYSIMSLMIEMDKLSDKINNSSKYGQYINLWTRPDIYYMYMNTYNFVRMTRTGEIILNKDTLTIFLSILKFTRIPNMEVYYDNGVSSICTE